MVLLMVLFDHRTKGDRVEDGKYNQKNNFVMGCHISERDVEVTIKK